MPTHGDVAGRAAPIVIGVVGVAILVTLGAWQVQRLSWKEGLISEIEQKMQTVPIPIPDLVDAEEHKLLRVEATGLLGQEELHAIHSIKRRGPGYRLIVPFDLTDGRTILADLGFVPEAAKDVRPRTGSVRWETRPADADRVVGFLHWPNETDSFTPEPDLGRNIWFARDVEAMARALGTKAVLLIAERHPDDGTTTPQPPGVDLPNRHLEYALTWFGLAIVWATMSVFWLRSRLRQPAT
ncbi:MAG: SURF1 family protein [Pseudomonadota bacterium]